ncbi:hypothetical protein NUM3379_41300 [Kineococcus sp. NUM-3379]
MAGRELDVAFQVDEEHVLPEDARWLEELPALPREEQDELAERLRGFCDAEDPATSHLAGLALARLGRHDVAVLAFDRARRSAPGDPLVAVNSAVALLHVGDLARARLLLLPVADGDGPLGRVASRYVGEVDRVSTILERETRWTVLRVGFLRERVVRGTAQDRERLDLAHALTTLLWAGHAGHDWDEPLALLEDLHERLPREPEVLQLLALLYSGPRPGPRLHEVLLLLEDVEPDSPTLQALDGHRRGEAAERSAAGDARARELLVAAMEGGPGAEAAVASLRALVQRFPDSLNRRSMLMFALLGVSDVEGALVEARWLEALPGPDHERHFNLGQVFWSAGDTERGAHHFAEAHRLARDDEQRRDVLEAVRARQGRVTGAAR